MYQDVLIPTDGSDAAERSIEHAFGLAEGLGATLHALSVREGPGAMQQDQLRNDPEEAVNDALADIERRAERAGVELTTAVREGVARDEILDYAATNDVDLIVMGTHDRTGLDRVLDDSVAEAVLENSPVPVLTVRAEA